MARPKSFIISDTHFDHENIIRYCNRPFKDLSEMNREIVTRWNMAVRPQDTVFFVGDLCFGNRSKMWLNALNGNKILIRGNHDRLIPGMKRAVKLKSYTGEKFLMIHAPEWIDRDFNGWVFHGHHHNNLVEEYPLINPDKKTFNVSAELLDYTPIEVIKLLQMREDYQ
jgi:calcineurin-like phosphoesterase family protein